MTSEEEENLWVLPQDTTAVGRGWGGFSGREREIKRHLQASFHCDNKFLGFMWLLEATQGPSSAAFSQDHPHSSLLLCLILPRSPHLSPLQPPGQGRIPHIGAQAHSHTHTHTWHLSPLGALTPLSVLVYVCVPPTDLAPSGQAPSTGSGP